MNYSWKYKLMIGMTLMGILQGCQSTDDKGMQKKDVPQTTSSAETKTIKSDVGVTREIDGIAITLQEAGYTDQRNTVDSEQPQQVVRLLIHIKNTSETEFGIGSGNFTVYDEEGNPLDVYGLDDSFGDMIPSGNELTGSSYYKVNEKQPYKVVYKNMDEQEKGEWKIEDIKNFHNKR